MGLANTLGNAGRLPPSLQHFEAIADVRVTLTGELDRRPISFGELLRFEPGTVVVLNRPAGENIDLLVGDVLLGSGEILIVDGTLAIRVADLRDRSITTPKALDSDEESESVAA